MKENEAKALFIHQYYDQMVLMQGKSTHRIDCYNISMLTRSKEIDSCYLLLRSIENLTDEEKAFITESYYQDGRNENASKEYINSCFNLAIDFGKLIPPVIYQLLLRMGILLPFTYLSETNEPITLTPSQLIERGWTKLTTNPLL